MTSDPERRHAAIWVIAVGFSVLMIGFFVLAAIRLHEQHQFCMAHPTHASCLNAGG